MKPDRYNQIDRILEGALERAPDERAAFVQQTCAGNEVLIHEVQSLLAAYQSVENFMERPALEVAARNLAENKVQLEVGRQVGSYRILSLLGVGAMGEVYRAHDTKLGREVAIKILPEVFEQDPERLARFEREAQLLASLNHPNIAMIHGLEESNRIRFLVLELVPGETLADLLKAGPLRVERALRIFSQVAEALEAAHDRAIIHRDLKPANIKVTPEGKVKLLDFGVAKAFPASDVQSNPWRSLRDTASGLSQGVILGTPAYMSPEQARGKVLDKRSDIWSFGCVCYEALTCRRPFAGETVSDTLASILDKEPDWSALPDSTPPGVRVLLHRCLEKDVHRRLHDIADARIEIQDALILPATSPPQSSLDIRSASGWRALLWVFTYVLVGGLAASIAVWNLKPSPPPTPRRFASAITPAESFSDLSVPAVAISPDGNLLAYAASTGGIEKIFLRTTDQFEGIPIHGIEGGTSPFFSPDGKWIGFSANGKLKKISTNGGEAVTICDASQLRGASWGPNDTILFSRGTNSGLSLVSTAVNSTPQPVTTLNSEKGDMVHRWPEFLPDGKAFLFTIGRNGGNWNDAQVVVQSLETGERRVLVKRGTYGRYVPTGHLVYALEGTLMAVRVNLSRLSVEGEPVAITEGVMQRPTGVAQFSFSRLGRLVYVPGEFEASKRKLVWVDRRGRTQLLTERRHAYANPRLSPKGDSLAVVIQGRIDQDVWVHKLDSGTLSRVTDEKRPNYEGLPKMTAIWTRDGRHLTFSSSDAGTNLFRKPDDGGGTKEELLAGDSAREPTSWSPDDRFLLFTQYDRTSDPDIWVLPFKAGGKARRFIATPSAEMLAEISPDGNWVAYTSNETSHNEVYVVSFSNPSGKRQPISTQGGYSPRWASGGRELFYRTGNKMMLVTIETTPSFHASTPMMLFDNGRYEPGYDVTPDGTRFVMIERGESRTQLNVIQDWFEGLSRGRKSNN